MSKRASAVAPRSVAIKVNLTPELHERLREVAAQLGQALATIASIAIGSFVAQQARSLDAAARMVEAMAAQAGPAMTEQMRILGEAWQEKEAPAAQALDKQRVEATRQLIQDVHASGKGSLRALIEENALNPKRKP